MRKASWKNFVLLGNIKKRHEEGSLRLFGSLQTQEQCRMQLIVVVRSVMLPKAHAMTPEEEEESHK